MVPGPASRLPPSAGPWAARGGAEARAAAAGAERRLPGGEMSAPYGSLMRYLFPALLLHGECGAGWVARGSQPAGWLPMARPRRRLGCEGVPQPRWWGERVAGGCDRPS